MQSFFSKETLFHLRVLPCESSFYINSFVKLMFAEHKYVKRGEEKKVRCSCTFFISLVFVLHTSTKYFLANCISLHYFHIITLKYNFSIVAYCKLYVENILTKIFNESVWKHSIKRTLNLFSYWLFYVVLR